MLTPVTSQGYLTTHQSENCARADHVPHDPLPHFVFKNPSLKAIGGFRSFEHKLPSLLSWPGNKHCISFTATWCQQLGFAAHQASGPKFGSVTLGQTLFSTC